MTTPPTTVDGAARRPAADDLDRELRRDVRMLGEEVGHVLQRLGSPGIFDLVERVRRLAKARRAGQGDADAQLRTLIAGLDLSQMHEVIQALLCFLDLSNLAEDRHRIRVIREREAAAAPAPRRESIGDAVRQLAADGRSATDMQALLDSLDIELVFTAHPTEAKRPTVRQTLRRVRDDLIDLHRDDLLPRERERVLLHIRTDLACLWDTDPLGPRKPTVLEEVQRGLFVADSLWHVVPWLYRSLRTALDDAYPGHVFRIPTFLRFGSWIGGDRDGNPFVTAAVTAKALARLRKRAIDLQLAHCNSLRSRLSLSAHRGGVSPALQAALSQALFAQPRLKKALAAAHPDEVYLHWLRVIAARLQATRRLGPTSPPTDAAYAHAGELARDVHLIADSLREHGHTDLADGPVQYWLDRIAVFGFHVARLDVRENAAQLRDAVTQLARELGICPDASALAEPDLQALLSEPVDPVVARRLDPARLDEPVQQTLALFELLHRTAHATGTDGLGTLIVSMTHRPSDVLAMMWLTHLAAARGRPGQQPALRPVVPLFETIDDLVHAQDILDALLAIPAYRRHVEATGNVQVCMVGYSDSTKDGGYLASNWHLHGAQRRLAAVVEKHGVKMMLFHGRGGSLGRGGGPAARGILSLPGQSVRGKLRMTEQGEVLAERYDNPEIAFRHLEQVTWATMLVSARAHHVPRDEHAALLGRAADAAFAHYRKLIEDADFIAYFRQATPIATIESLPIGSRPSRRQKQWSLAGLRAIPYTFAWTQNRHFLTAFYGLGTGLTAAAQARGDTGWAAFTDMYGGWPLFRAIIDNCELALVKFDAGIGQHYAELCDDPQAGQRIWAMIDREAQLARQAILHITGQTELMGSTPWLQHSVRVRNPYIDPLNFMQIELMKRARAGDEDPRLTELLRLSVQAVAAGVRTTG